MAPSSSHVAGWRLNWPACVKRWRRPLNVKSGCWMLDVDEGDGVEAVQEKYINDRQHIFSIGRPHGCAQPIAGVKMHHEPRPKVA
jgi:hypothetical protein